MSALFIYHGGCFDGFTAAWIYSRFVDRDAEFLGVKYGDAPPDVRCGHASAWHRVTERWIAACTVPDCPCRNMDACNCVAGLDESSLVEHDVDVLSALGIML